MIELRQDQEQIQQIADRSVALLQEKFGITLKGSSAQAVPTMVYCFLTAAIEHVNSNKSEEEPYEINLFQLADLGVSYNEDEEAEKEGNFVPYIRPGQEMKLLIKDDGVTEE